MIAVQPIIAVAGSGELHWDICALEAPGAIALSTADRTVLCNVLVEVSVFIGGAEAAIADEVERANIAATKESAYRITFSTGWGERRYSPKLWIENIIAAVCHIRKQRHARAAARAA
jgi:hypothetical protein